MNESPSTKESPTTSLPREWENLVRDPRAALERDLANPLLRRLCPALLGRVEAALNGHPTVRYIRRLWHVVSKRMGVQQNGMIINVEGPELRGTPVEHLIASAYAFEEASMPRPTERSKQYTAILTHDLLRLSRIDGFLGDVVRARLQNRTVEELMRHMEPENPSSDWVDGWRPLYEAFSNLANLALLRGNTDPLLCDELIRRTAERFSNVNVRDDVEASSLFVESTDMPGIVAARVYREFGKEQPRILEGFIQEIASAILAGRHLPTDRAELEQLWEDKEDPTIEQETMEWARRHFAQDCCQDPLILEAVSGILKSQMGIETSRPGTRIAKQPAYTFDGAFRGILDQHRKTRETAAACLRHLSVTSAAHQTHTTDVSAFIQLPDAVLNLFSMRSDAVLREMSAFGSLLRQVGGGEWTKLSDMLENEEKTSALDRLLMQTEKDEHYKLTALGQFAKWLRSEDRREASAIMLRGWAHLATIEAPGTHEKLYERIGCEQYARELDTYRRAQNWKVVEALENEIIGRVMREIVQYPYFAEGIMDGSFIGNFPRTVVDHKSLTCYSGPWLLATMLLKCGFRYEQLFSCNIFRSPGQTVFGTHGGLLISTTEKELVMAETTAGKLSRPLRLSFCPDAGQRAQMRALLSGASRAPVNLSVDRTMAGTLDLPERMHVLPLATGFMSSHLLHSGIAFLHDQSYDQAAYVFEMGLDVYPRDPDLLCYRGYAEFASGRLPAARPFLELALAVEPEHLLAHFFLGELESREGHEASALAHFLSVVEDRRTIWGDDGEIKKQAQRYVFALQSGNGNDICTKGQ